MIDMVHITIPQSDQAPSSLVSRLYNGIRNGTLTPRDLDVTKFVPRSTLASIKDSETRLGENGDLRLISKEEATIDTTSVASVLLHGVSSLISVLIGDRTRRKLEGSKSSLTIIAST